MLPLVERNLHQVGMLLLVERDCHHWVIPLLERNVHQGLHLVDSNDQSIPLVESGDQGPMNPSEHICLPLVERDGWKVLNVWLPFQRDEGVSCLSNKSRSHLPQ